MMELREVTKHYPQGRRVVKALNGVSLKIEAGEFVSIMGPSGSGKSTLMHLLGALDTPTSGQVFFQGKPLHSMSDRELSTLRRNKIGFVFQFFNLLPTLTAVENVALPLLLACDPAPPPVREGESQSAVSMEAVAINLCQTTIWCGFVTSNDLTSCDRTSVPEACGASSGPRPDAPDPPRLTVAAERVPAPFDN